MKKIIFLFGVILNLQIKATAAPLDPCQDLWRFYCSKTIELDKKNEERSYHLLKLMEKSASDHSKDVYDLLITDARALEALKIYTNNVKMDDDLPKACNASNRFEKDLCLRTFSELLVLANLQFSINLDYVPLDELLSQKNKIISEKLQSIAIDLSFKQKVKDVIFPRIKQLLLTSLKDKKLPAEQQTEFSNKIREINYEDSVCDEEEAYNQAFYIAETNTIRLCDNFFKSSQNIYSAVQAMAHEMAHSMLPCQIDDQTRWNDKYVMKDITSKLRSEPAIGKKKELCNTDKTMEAIPDLFAVEVLTQYHKNYPEDFAKVDPIMGIATIFSVPWECEYTASEMEEEFNDDPHPTYHWRINRVIGANPYIRKLLQCSK